MLHTRQVKLNLKLTLTFVTVATRAMEFHPTPEVPALQYVGSVEENGAASEAGLSAGDFIIEVHVHVQWFLLTYYYDNIIQYVYVQGDF